MVTINLTSTTLSGFLETDFDQIKLLINGEDTGDLADAFKVSTDTMDAITDGSTYVKTENNYSDAEKTKLGYISVTQAVDLDQLETDSHVAVTVADTSEIDLTLTGQQISADIIVGSIDVLKLDSGVQTSLGLADSSLQSSDIGVSVQAYSVVLQNTTASFLIADETKLDFISITQAVDLDQIETDSHVAVTVSDSSEIDFTLTGQDITASIITGSIDVLKLDSGVQTSLGLADSAVQNLSDLSITATAAEINVLDGIPGTLTAIELGYVDGVTSAIQTQLDAKSTASKTETLTNKTIDADNNTISNLEIGAEVDPKLTTDLDLNNKSLTREGQVGEAVVAGDHLYLKTTDSKWWKTDASAEATAKGELRIATESGSADATITLGVPGYRYVTTGLTAGEQYLSETAGAVTGTRPTTSASIVRIAGTNESTTVFLFNPDGTYVENA